MSRTTIRQAFVSTLTGLVTTGARVYGSRLANYASDALPALNVYLMGETVTEYSAGYDGIVEVEVLIECYAKSNTDLDEELDLILSEVQVAINAVRLTTFRSLAKLVIYDGCDVEYEIADEEVGKQTIKYRVQYEQRL